MPDDPIPQRSFDWKLSLILMVIVAICYIGYRVGNGGPRPEEVPCAPGQAEVTDCNEELAAPEKGDKEQGKEREMEGAAPK
jgi:hypothetical protein